MNPKWSAADVDIELATLRDWDKRTILGFVDTRPMVPPLRLVAPSLVILAEKSLLISDAVAARMRRQGMTVGGDPGHRARGVPRRVSATSCRRSVAGCRRC